MRNPANSTAQVWLTPGTTIGHYRVEQLISSGGFGAVYRVSRNGQQFALKLPLSPGAADERRITEQRIIREVVSLMTLSHPNIVRVHGYDRWPEPDTGALYLVMDFVEGVPLLQWRRNERPTVREVVRLFQALALAVDQMHRLGVVHRDIKSSNVLVSCVSGGADPAAPRASKTNGATRFDHAGSPPRPVLVDFGLARPAFTTDVTREHVLLGTEGLWAPEVLLAAVNDSPEGEEDGAHPRGSPRSRFSAASDLHALGLLFYEALTGQRALRTTSRDFTAVLSEMPRPPSSVAASIPEALDGPVMKLLAKAPEDRTANGAELARELEAILASADERLDSALPPFEPTTPEAPTLPQRPGTPRAPVLLERTAEVERLPAEERSSTPTDATATVTTRVHPPQRVQPAQRKRHLMRNALLAAVIALTLLAAGFRAISEKAGDFTSWAARTVKTAPSPPAPAAVVIGPSAPSPSREVPPRRATNATRVATTASARASVVRAVITGPLRAGNVEAELREPLVVRGLVLLPVGTALAGSATPLDDGGFAMRFSSARVRSGGTTAVQGSARLDARASQRQPLRRGVTPQQLEFDVTLSVRHASEERARNVSDERGSTPFRTIRKSSGPGSSSDPASEERARNASDERGSTPFSTIRESSGAGSLSDPASKERARR